MLKRQKSCEDNKQLLGPDDQLLHIRSKPTKAEANKTQRDRPQSFGGFEYMIKRALYDFLFQMHQSNEHQVVLKKVKIGSSGRYKCEVGEM